MNATNIKTTYFCVAKKRKAQLVTISELKSTPQNFSILDKAIFLEHYP